MNYAEVNRELRGVFSALDDVRAYDELMKKSYTEVVDRLCVIRMALNKEKLNARDN